MCCSFVYRAPILLMLEDQVDPAGAPIPVVNSH